ncbi:MAG: TetR/AcrR family transcriptional regulator [Myxococcales bacterium]|nr:TetR/AcrR family transcriptional regulator [Myxococcales bacterium]MCB9520266.1 TetR/AcrR family transcriptional regulator [Myxococcales bacterium]MCB9531366.1 TetR/AcrR family transcriptional regulator [Myxococcales bacterium]MCB9533561.1 TetR/AcrR family transcriptional regulator [Myxococcales bacterium]
MRKRLLEAAAGTIADRGFGATSVDDVIRAAGVARGTFYQYFAGRDAILLELVETFVGRLRSAIEPIPATHPAPVVALRENMRRVLGILTENGALTTVLLRDAVGHGDSVDGSVNALYDFVQGMVVGALRRGAERGITRRVDDAIIATAIVGAMKELLYVRVVQAGDALDVDRVVGELFELGLRGLAV